MWFVVTSMLLLSHISHVQLCDPMGYSPPGSSIHEILQARILEWVTMPSSRGSSQPRDQTQVSCIAGRFFTTGLPGKTSHFHAMCLVMSESLQPPELLLSSWDFSGKNTRVGHHSLLQGIFPTQELYLSLLCLLCLLQCRLSLYHLSHYGSSITSMYWYK